MSPSNERCDSRSFACRGWLSAVALVLALAGCSHHDDDDASGHEGHGTAGSAGAAGSGAGVAACGSGAGLVFTPDMAAEGAAKKATFKLRTMSDVPPVNGKNSWVVQVLDATGAPVDGATLSVKPFMPAHGHGASVTPTATGQGNGEYRIDDLVFSMPGVWQTTLTLGGVVSDSVVFSFCVPG